MTDRIGVVWIAADTDVEGMGVTFHGYWDGGRAVLEQMPETYRAVDAIRWGLARTDDVRIRFDGWNYFWAGFGQPPAGEPEFAGTVVLSDEPPRQRVTRPGAGVPSIKVTPSRCLIG